MALRRGFIAAPGGAPALAVQCRPATSCRAAAEPRTGSIYAILLIVRPFRPDNS